MYIQFAREARQEGFNDLAYLFEAVGKIEQEHEQRFNALLSDVQNNRVFEKESSTEWICANCGHTHYGAKAPEVCPVCSSPKAYFSEKEHKKG